MENEKFILKGAPTTQVVYPHGLFVKTKPKNVTGEDKEKYNAVFIIPKTDTEKVAQVQHHFDVAFKLLQAAGFKGKSVANIDPKNVCWVDGDDFADRTGANEYRGFMRLSASSKMFRPKVFDDSKLVILNGVPDGTPIEQQSSERLEDGDYVVPKLSFWVYNKVGVGIGCNIEGLKRVAAGTPIGGGGATADEFENYE